MAVSKSAITITWPTSQASVSVSAGSNATSEAFAIDDSAFDGAVHVKADNAGTPASGDTIDVYLLQSLDGGSDYDTAGHGLWLGRLDTNLEDAAEATYQIPVVASHAKLYAVSSAASNSITVSAEGRESKA